MNPLAQTEAEKEARALFLRVGAFALLSLLLVLVASPLAARVCPDCTGHSGMNVTACTTWEFDLCGNACRIVTFYQVNCATGEIIWEDVTEATCFGWCPFPY